MEGVQEFYEMGHARGSGGMKSPEAEAKREIMYSF